MGANCARCCICYCFKFIECPAFCRCPVTIRSVCGEFCECGDCCDVVDDDMEAVLQERALPKAGEASFTYENGDVYHGQWKNGLRHGKGELIRSDNTRLQGYFHNDEFIGEKPSQQTEPEADEINQPDPLV